MVLYSTGYDGYTAGLWGNESNYHNFPFFFLCVNSGDPAVQILHMLLSMQTSLAILLLVLPLPSPAKHDSLSLHHRISKEATSTVFCHLFFGLLLLKSYEKVMEVALYFWDHHTPNQIVAKPTEALDTVLVYLAIVAITKPCTKA